MRSLRFLLALVLGLAGGCAASPSTPLPAGAELLSAAASSFATVRSTHFSLGVNGVLPGLPLRQIEGDATVDDGGRATGTADVQDDVRRVKFSFDLRGGEVTRTDPSGTVREPVPPEFAVSALLGPQGGLRRLLDGVGAARTEGRERVEDVDAFRVGGVVPVAVVSRVLPQIHADVTVKVWVSESEPRQFVRLWLQVPPPGEHQSPVMFELGLTRQNAVVVR
ncbi:LppX_LprAFG lipoprotein [Amycolatopsis sp. NPDC059021]|uniref:LppX_LprAFG lipoprotein n=1 Tax=Amycolatopsis sp. NPDC059021 TaxID=3346704 RepID=UPI00366FA4EE